METSFDLRKAVETAGREVDLHNLNNLGLNRVRVLKMSDIHQLVQAVVSQSIETRVMAEVAAEGERLASQIAIKEVQLKEATTLRDEKARELESELEGLKAQKEIALTELNEKKAEWELEKQKLSAEAHEKVRAALQGASEQTREQESRLRLSESARQELADKLACFVEETQSSRAAHDKAMAEAGRESAALRAELDKAKALVAEKGRLETLIESLIAEKAALSGHLEEMRIQAGKALEETRRARTELEESLSRFARERSADRQEHEANLASEREVAEAERHQLETLLNQTRQSLEIESVAHRQMEEERAALEQRTLELKSFLEGLQLENNRLQSSLGEVQKAKAALASEAASLSGRLDGIQKSFGDLESRHAQALEESASFKLLAQERLAHSETQARELEKLRAAKAELEMSVNALKRQTADQQVELGREAESRKTLEETLADREQALADVKSQAASLQLALGTLRSLHETECNTNIELLGQKAELEHSLNVAGQQTIEAKARIRTLEEQLHNLTDNLGRETETRHHLETELATRTESLHEVGEQLASAHRSLGTLRTLLDSERNTYKDLLARHAELEQALTASRGEASILLSRVEASDSRIVELTSELDGERTQALSLAADIKAVSGERNDLLVKVSLQEETLRERQREIARQAQDLARQRAELEEAGRKAESDSQTLASLRSDIDSLSGKLSAERAEATTVRAQCADLERRALGSEEGRAKSMELLNAERLRREALELKIPELELQAARRVELEAELASVRAQLVTEGAESLRHLQELGQWKSRSVELADSLRQIETAQKSWEARCREYQKAYLSRKQSHVKVEEEARQLRDKVKILEDDLREFEAAQSEHLRELADYDALKKSSQESEAALKAENDSLLKTFNRLTQELECSRTALAARDEALKAEREKVASFRRQMGALLLTETERLLGSDAAKAD
ncbi:MAG: hypothetical protein AB7F75_00955 [Planctomycetota bacterium]